MKNYCSELQVLINLAKVGLASYQSEHSRKITPDEIVGIKDLAGHDVVHDLTVFTDKMVFLLNVLQAKVLWIIETTYDDGKKHREIRRYDGSDGNWSVTYLNENWGEDSNCFVLQYDVDSTSIVPLHDVFLTEEGAKKALRKYGK